MTVCFCGNTTVRASLSTQKETPIKVSSISLKYFFDKPVIAEKANQAEVYSELVEVFNRVFVVGFASLTEKYFAKYGIRRTKSSRIHNRSRWFFRLSY